MGKIIQVTPQMKQAVKEIMDIAKGSRDYFGVKSYLDGYDLSVMKTADAEQIQKLMDNIEYIVEDMRIRSKIVILTDHIRGMTRREETRMPQKTHRNNVVTLPCAIGDLVYQALYTPMSGYFVREGKIQKISVIGKGNSSIDIKLEVSHTDDQTVGFIDANSIGKTVFFTQEEAKEAIRILEEQEREGEPELLDRKLATMLFCQYFEVSCLMDELMEKVETDALLDFISEKFREEYSIEEFLQFNEDHSTCELGCLNDEEKAAVIAALFQTNYDDAKKQLEAFQDEKEPDFDEWWENLDDIEREEYNRWCQESELE